MFQFAQTTMRRSKISYCPHNCSRSFPELVGCWESEADRSRLNRI
uniref:Uncharacterized protein n=1 Tax=Arundo donax TaxID=35708 RepID=A0A0A9DHH3_ARUDO